MANLRIIQLPNERVAANITNPESYYIELDSVNGGTEKFRLSEAAKAIQSSIGINHVIIGDAAHEIESNALSVVASTDTPLTNNSNSSATDTSKAGDLGQVWSPSDDTFEPAFQGDTYDVILKGSIKKTTAGMNWMTFKLVSNLIQVARCEVLLVEDAGVEQKFECRLRVKIDANMFNNGVNLVVFSNEDVSIWGYEFGFFRIVRD